ncbi:MAG: diguanylate cyclase with sensor [Peptococcaceae bacterium]|nr:diguanylate cyclase with sensor [Peptococcaceae bacterium]
MTVGIIEKETQRKRKDGNLVHVHVLAYPIVVNDQQFGIYAIYSDISKRKEADEKLQYLSLHDALTGLYNRAYFQEIMRTLEKGPIQPVGMIICDVDGLKLINDTLGHEIGDSLLITTAEIISTALGTQGIAARIGGDEFAI